MWKSSLLTGWSLTTQPQLTGEILSTALFTAPTKDPRRVLTVRLRRATPTPSARTISRPWISQSSSASMTLTLHWVTSTIVPAPHIWVLMARECSHLRYLSWTQWQRVRTIPPLLIPLLIMWKVISWVPSITMTRSISEVSVTDAMPPAYSTRIIGGVTSGV